MRPLKLNQKFLTLVSLRASPDDITRPEKLLNTAVGLYVFVTFCLDLISSSFFVIQYKKRELEDVLGSVLQIAAVLSNIIAMSHVFMHSKQLQGIFSQFQAIYNECNYRHLISKKTYFNFIPIFFSIAFQKVHKMNRSAFSPESISFRLGSPNYWS